VRLSAGPRLRGAGFSSCSRSSFSHQSPAERSSDVPTSPASLQTPCQGPRGRNPTRCSPGSCQPSSRRCSQGLIADQPERRGWGRRGQRGAAWGRRVMNPIPQPGGLWQTPRARSSPDAEDAAGSGHGGVGSASLLLCCLLPSRFRAMLLCLLPRRSRPRQSLFSC